MWLVAPVASTLPHRVDAASVCCCWGCMQVLKSAFLPPCAGVMHMFTLTLLLCCCHFPLSAAACCVLCCALRCS